MILDKTEDLSHDREIGCKTIFFFWKDTKRLTEMSYKKFDSGSQ